MSEKMYMSYKNAKEKIMIQAFLKLLFNVLN